MTKTSPSIKLPTSTLSNRVRSQLHTFCTATSPRGTGSKQEKMRKNLWSPVVNVQRQSLQGAKRLDEGAPEKYGKESFETGL